MEQKNFEPQEAPEVEEVDYDDYYDDDFWDDNMPCGCCSCCGCTCGVCLECYEEEHEGECLQEYVDTEE